MEELKEETRDPQRVRKLKGRGVRKRKTRTRVEQEAQSMRLPLEHVELGRSSDNAQYSANRICATSQNEIVQQSPLYSPFREPYFASGDIESWGTRSDERKRLVRLGFLHDEESSSREELVQPPLDVLEEIPRLSGKRPERMVVRLFNAFQSSEKAHGWLGLAQESLQRAALPVLMKAFVLVLEIHAALLSVGLVLETRAAGSGAQNGVFSIVVNVFVVRVAAFLLVRA